MSDSIEEWASTYREFAEIVEAMGIELEKRDEHDADDR